MRVFFISNLWDKISCFNRNQQVIVDQKKSPWVLKQYVCFVECVAKFKQRHDTENKPHDLKATAEGFLPAVSRNDKFKREAV